ncbi:hypothetical protein RchiOBHm_Chr2g0170911 [Rosa chinensis]|uniref:Uncharacterized protein n=1 Tax=Rosa chinensis TaxID=74649 RepID=A0A2P6S580_ROSCH|nr:hypothetical protein RchiOBHm_Chr2g0170911 [Rosa chinensis]
MNPFEPTLKTFVSSPSLPYHELSTGYLYPCLKDLVEHDIVCRGDDERQVWGGENPRKKKEEKRKNFALKKKKKKKKKERKAAKEKKTLGKMLKCGFGLANL